MKADLHVHTAVSDSSYSIEETIQLAKLNNIHYLGIVDHDTVAGLEQAIFLGKHYGVLVIPGIEISAYDYKRKRKVHILGYNFDLNASNINKLCAPIIERRHNHSLWQIRQLQENGFQIDIEDVLQKSQHSTCIYKQHIMAVLVDKGYCSHVHSNLYQKLFKGQGICVGEIEYIDVFAAVTAVKADGGIAVLAHPGQLNSYTIMEELRESGLDGVELFHEDHTQEDHQKIQTFAAKHDVILTGGSDFHGAYGGKTKLGQLTFPLDYVKDILC
ncbi:MAG: PHP domain-containing protein [Clostridiales bacterium]|jgi:predicted metal-dependent phosphoesterase TrpH|nr:PHP domain-containing protein [Clostridiales bacterium]